MDFTTMDAGTVMSGKDKDGTRYLELFLQEYSKEFSTAVNPGCPKCISEYLSKYKQKMKKSDNTTGYVLKAKYEGLQLEFGSQTFVTNANMTKEYGEQLLKNHPRGADLFESLPDDAGKADGEPTEEDKLKAAVVAAKAKIAGHKAGTQQRYKDAHFKSLADAEKALENYYASQADGEKANQVEVVLTQEHFENAPDLAEAYKVGDKVIVETSGVEGEITIIGLAEEKE